jgi:type II secretory pathway pseudopilin PulG
MTIVELALVLGILAVLVAMAAPRYAGAMSRYHADLAARRIASDLDLARSRARSYSLSCTVTFSTAGNSYTVSGVQDLKNPLNTYSVNLAEEPYGAKILSANFGGSPAVTFNGFGQALSDGTILVQAGQEKRTIAYCADEGTCTLSAN